MNRLDKIDRARNAKAKAKALQKATVAVHALRDLGVVVKIGGSLARDDFHAGSDTDFVILDPGGIVHEQIFTVIEQTLRSFHFDILHPDSIRSDYFRQQVLNDAVDIEEIRVESTENQE